MRIVTSHQKLTMTNQEPSSKLMLLQLHEKWPKNSMSTILWSLSIWSKLGRWESLINGYLISWLRIKQNCHSKMLSLTVCNSEPFLHQIVMYVKMWILWQPATTSSVVGLRRGSKHFHGKKCHGHCLVVSCWSDPLQISESWLNHCLWEVCSANRREAWTLQWLQLALVNRKGPIFLNSAQSHVAQPVLQKLNELACEVSPHPSYSSDL